MRIRRKILLAAACVIGLADVGYAAWLRFSIVDDMQAEWVAYMPALEAKQRRNPANFLESSESHDPEYPLLYVSDGGGSYPVFSKLAADCRITEYTISKYMGPNKTMAVAAMPDRLFLGKLNAAMVSCLRTSLPRGYVLAKLQGPVSPQRTGWGENDLHIAAGITGAQDESR